MNSLLKKEHGTSAKGNLEWTKRLVDLNQCICSFITVKIKKFTRVNQTDQCYINEFTSSCKVARKVCEPIGIGWFSAVISLKNDLFFMSHM